MGHRTLSAVALGAVLVLPSRPSQDDPSGRSLEETRLVMGKWIETQQIISKERNEWQQGKEVLLGRLEVVKKEISTLEEKIQQAQSAVDEAEKKRTALAAENGGLKAVGKELSDSALRMEGDGQVFIAVPGR